MIVEKYESIGGETIFGDFTVYCKAHGVIKQPTVAYTPQGN
jgi:hypothetical protein